MRMAVPLALIGFWTILLAIIPSALGLNECADCGKALTNLLDGTAFEFEGTQVETGGIKLDIRSISCSNIAFEYIAVESDEKSVLIETHGIGFKCRINLHWALSVGFPHGSSVIDAVSSTTSFGIGADFKFDKDNVPQEILINHCNASPSFKKITFRGGIVQKISGMIVKLLKPTLQKIISKQTCSQLPPILSKKGSQFFRMLNSHVHPYLHVVPKLDIPKISSGSKLINFNEEKALISTTRKLFESKGTNDRLLLLNILNFLTGSKDKLEVKQLGYNISIGDDGLSKTDITISTFSIKGLDSLNALKLFKSVQIEGYPGNYSLEFDFGFESLEVYADGFVTLAPGSFVVKDKGTVVEFASVNFGLHNLRLKMILHLEIEADELMQLSLKQIDYNPLGCLALSLLSSNATFVDATIGSFDVPRIDGFSGVSPLFNEIISVLNQLFGKISLDVLHGALSSSIKSIMNDLVNKALHKNRINKNLICPQANDLSIIKSFDQSSDILDFRTSKMASYIRLFSNLIGINSPVYFDINHVINILTDGSNSINFPGTLWKFSTDLGREYGIDFVEFDISNFSISNLDSFSQLSILNPTSRSMSIINNTIEIGGPTPNKSLELSIGLRLELKGPSVKNINSLISDNVYLRLSALGLLSSMDIDLLISRLELMNLTIGNLLDLKNACILDSFKNASVNEIIFRLQELGLGLLCISCSSNAFREWEHILQNKESEESINRDVKAILSHANGDYFRNIANNYVFSTLISHHNSCTAASLFDSMIELSRSYRTEIQDEFGSSDKESNLPIVWIVISTCTGCGVLVGIIALNVNFSGDTTVSQRVQERPFIDSYRRRSSVDLKYLRRSLFRQSFVPKWAKIAIPSLLIADIAIFIIANLSVGASVFFFSQFAGDKIELPSLFSFSLGNSVRDMWDAKVYPLALLILVFSGMWPYVKALTLLACWMLPTTRLSHNRRKSFLKWLDILGKWSLVDAYVLVLMMVAFRFHMTSPASVDYLPSDMFSLDVIVYPGLGIFMFLVGAILQLVITHIIIYWDKKALEVIELLQQEKKQQDNSINQENIGLISSVENEGQISEDLNLEEFEPSSYEGLSKVSNFVKLLVCLLLITSITFGVYGSLTPSFRFEFKGAAGFALGDNSIQRYSLISVADALLSSEPGVLFIYIVFLLFGFVVPILQLLILLVLWVIPMTFKWQKRGVFLSEILRAVGAVDVFIVSVAVALFELKQFVDFIIGDRCDFINTLMAKYAHGSLGGEDVCFNVMAELDPQCWVLIVGASLGILSSLIVCDLCDNALENNRMYRKTGDAISIQSSSFTVTTNRASYKVLRFFRLVDEAVLKE